MLDRSNIGDMAVRECTTASIVPMFPGRPFGAITYLTGLVASRGWLIASPTDGKITPPPQKRQAVAGSLYIVMHKYIYVRIYLDTYLFM